MIFLRIVYPKWHFSKNFPDESQHITGNFFIPIPGALTIYESDPYICGPKKTVGVAQLVRASDCGSEGRGFEPHHLPRNGKEAVHNRQPLSLYYFLL